MTILQRLQQINIQLSLTANNSLAVTAPRGTITDEVRIEIRAHKPELLLACYQRQAEASCSLAELHQLLKVFNRQKWSLLDRSAMSSAYTPTALSLIEDERSNKWQTLDTLAALCWGKSSV